MGLLSRGNRILRRPVLNRRLVNIVLAWLYRHTVNVLDRFRPSAPFACRYKNLLNKNFIVPMCQIYRYQKIHGIFKLDVLFLVGVLKYLYFCSPSSEIFLGLSKEHL